MLISLKKLIKIGKLLNSLLSLPSLSVAGSLWPNGCPIGPKQGRAYWMSILSNAGGAGGGRGATLLFTQVTPMQGHPRYQAIHVGIKVERGLEFRFLIWEQAALAGPRAAPQLPSILLWQARRVPGPRKEPINNAPPDQHGHNRKDQSFGGAGGHRGW